MSFDDIAAFTLMTPRIAVVSQQAELMGRQGADLLLCRIRSGASDEGVTHSVPTMFINRGSVKQGPSAASPADCFSIFLLLLLLCPYA